MQNETAALNRELKLADDRLAQLEAELLQSVRDGLLPFEVFTEVATNPIWVQAKQKLEEYNKKMAEAQQIQPQ